MRFFGTPTIWTYFVIYIYVCVCVCVYDRYVRSLQGDIIRKFFEASTVWTCFITYIYIYIYNRCIVLGL